jgi:hypothetical protein
VHFIGCAYGTTACNQGDALPTIYEDTNPRKLVDLLYEIDKGMSVLPDFQRDFVWEPSLVRNLLASIASGYPAGSILRVRNTKHHFASRPFASAPKPSGAPSFLVLDGQQRLTSLYQAFYGTGDYRFYLDLAALRTKDDVEEAIFFERSDSKRDKALATLDAQAKREVLPLEILKGHHANVAKWIFDVAGHRAGNDLNAFKQLQRRLNDLAERWLRPIEDYQFPVVTTSIPVTSSMRDSFDKK